MPNPVRQYVGARYTAKVYENSLDPSSAEWESGRSWEPLILVTYNNSSYMSKKEVPSNIGDPAANPTYWVCTGYYNGQILNLQNQIDAINAVIGDIANLNTSDTTSIVNAINSILTDPKPMITSTNDLSNRKIILLTDSYGTMTDSNGRTFDYHFKDALGLDDSQVIFSAVAARGFTTSLGTPGNFLQMLQAISTDADSVTDIIVVGGANDVNATDSQLEGAIHTFILYAKSTYKNARVILAGAGRHNSDATMTIATVNIVAPAYENCGKYGGIGIKDFNLIFHNSEWLGSDAVHPNQTGVVHLGYKLAEGFLTGCVNIKYVKEATIDTTGTDWTTTSKWNEAMDNNSVVGCCPLLGTLTFTSSVDKAINVNLDLGKVPSYALGLTPYAYGLRVRVKGKRSDNSIVWFSGILFKIMDHLYLRASDSDDSNFTTYTDYRELTVMQFGGLYYPAKLS